MISFYNSISKRLCFLCFVSLLISVSLQKLQGTTSTLMDEIVIKRTGDNGDCIPTIISEGETYFIRDEFKVCVPWDPQHQPGYGAPVMYIYVYHESFDNMVGISSPISIAPTIWEPEDGKVCSGFKRIEISNPAAIEIECNESLQAISQELRVTVVGKNSSGDIVKYNELYRNIWTSHHFDISTMDIPSFVTRCCEANNDFWGLTMETGKTPQTMLFEKGKKKQDQEFEITVFPNPTRGNLYFISSRNYGEILDIEFFNLNGVLVLSKEIMIGSNEPYMILSEGEIQKAPYICKVNYSNKSLVKLIFLQ